jgi:hypothetical protein
MSKGNKKPKPKSDKTKLIIAYASLLTAIGAILKIILDFIIQLLSLGK